MRNLFYALSFAFLAISCNKKNAFKLESLEINVANIAKSDSNVKYIDLTGEKGNLNENSKTENYFIIDFTTSIVSGTSFLLPHTVEPGLDGAIDKIDSINVFLYENEQRIKVNEFINNDSSKHNHRMVILKENMEIDPIYSFENLDHFISCYNNKKDLCKGNSMKRPIIFELSNELDYSELKKTKFEMEIFLNTGVILKNATDPN